MNTQGAIITGAGTGIGFEIAKQLAKRGVKIILNDMDEEKAQSACQFINATGGECVAVVGDASDYSLIQQLVESALYHFGTLDLAIANAGITTFGQFIDYTPTAFDSLVGNRLLRDLAQARH